MRGYRDDGTVDAIRAAGGQIYALTSEPQTLAKNAEVDWQTGFEHVGDPHQEISRECQERGWLALFVADWGDDLVASEVDWVSHPKGFFQPGVLALNQSGRVLYRWRSRPDRKNVGGALMRPTPAHVWQRIESELEQPSDSPDAAHDDNPELDGTAPPWPLFIALLLANGWFVKPRTFQIEPGGPTVAARQRNALIRLVAFVALWIAAALSMPPLLVGTLFACWVVKITPGVRIVNRRFQNVGPGEEPS